MEQSCGRLNEVAVAAALCAVGASTGGSSCSSACSGRQAAAAAGPWRDRDSWRQVCCMQHCSEQPWHQSQLSGAAVSNTQQERCLEGASFSVHVLMARHAGPGLCHHVQGLPGDDVACSAPVCVGEFCHHAAAAASEQHRLLWVAKCLAVLLQQVCCLLQPALTCMLQSPAWLCFSSYGSCLVCLAWLHQLQLLSRALGSVSASRLHVAASAGVRSSCGDGGQLVHVCVHVSLPGPA
jgi:hypothetical protein